MSNKKLKSLKELENSLYGINNDVTYNTDVNSNPFPFSEEDNLSKERYEYGEIKTNNPK